MISDSSSVLILGAHGRFGMAATHAFLRAGWRVRVQSRRHSPAWPASVETVKADAMNARDLCAAAQSMDVIVNALNPPYTEWQRFALPLAENALAAAESSGALLMFPGNVYNFGNTLPCRLDPHTPQVGNTGKARIRIEIEQQLRAAAERGVNSAVVRGGDFFGGEGRGSWFDLAIVKSLGRGKMVYPGPLDLPHSWAYLPDFAETFVRLANLHKALSGANRFHFPGHAFTGRELHGALEQVSERHLKLVRLPWGLIRLSSMFSPMSRAILEMRYLWQRPFALEDNALREWIGEVPHTPGLAALATSLVALSYPAVRSA
ncbi:MAG TPA: NAD(P)H-binding protein [Burkholderiales bacterium]|nr:NAD(P)H-binding protein [Burkholderiales bacterium]